MKALDLRFAARGTRAPGGEVTVVGIDEEALAAVGRWPWPRRRLAELIDRLTEYGVAVVGIDAVFDMPDPSVDLGAIRGALDEVAARPAAATAAIERLRGQLDSDQRFAAALAASGRVVLGQFFEFGGASVPNDAPFPELSVRGRDGVGVGTLRGAARLHANLPVLARAAAGVGHVNFLPDPDGGFRKVALAVRFGERAAPALSVSVLQHALGVPSTMLALGPGDEASLVFGDQAVPIGPHGELWIDFAGPPGTFPIVSAAAVLDRRADATLLRDKIVLLAPTAIGFDSRPTPFSGSAAGVEIHATVIDDLLHGHALHQPPAAAPLEAALIVALAAAVGLLLHARVAVGVPAAALLGVAWLWGTQRLFATDGLVLSAVYPTAAVVVCTLAGTLRQYLAEARERRLVRQAFRQYLDPNVAEMLAREPERLVLGGERRDVSVLFTDIRGFTTIAESLSPEDLASLVTHHLDAETEIVFHHQGLLDKYIGDALMAFWGAPLDQPDHAARACRAALEMQAAVKAQAPALAERGWPRLEIRVGIASGPAVVGNFGSARRFNYTAIGDTVNLASRLEALGKAYGTGILLAEDTRRAVGDAFVCREVDRVRVRGKTRPVGVFELLARREDDVEGRLARRAAAFETALAAYRRRDWDGACGILNGLADEDPADALVGTYVGRCRHFAAAPPPADWDGVHAG